MMFVTWGVTRPFLVGVLVLECWRVGVLVCWRLGVELPKRHSDIYISQHADIYVGFSPLATRCSLLQLTRSSSVFTSSSCSVRKYKIISLSPYLSLSHTHSPTLYLSHALSRSIFIRIERSWRHHMEGIWQHPLQVARHTPLLPSSKQRESGRPSPATPCTLLSSHNSLPLPEKISIFLM